MRKLITLILLLFFAGVSYSQQVMTIYEKSGKVTRIPVENINRITFEGGAVSYHDDYVRDGDGNTYQTVTIGHQVWLKENLKTTRYNDGTPIQEVRDFNSWNTTKTGAFSWYMNNADNKEKYGALYNWHAVKSGKLCPKGFHVPVQEEWRALLSYLQSAWGQKLKVPGRQYWVSNTDGVTNETGFSALPGGERTNVRGTFQNEGQRGFWWTATADGNDRAIRYFLYGNSNGYSVGPMPNEFGFSVRCVRD